MDNLIERYFSFAADLLLTVARESGPAIQQAAVVIADAIQNDKDFLLFGSGHSGLVAQEAAGRAGGLAPALVIRDIADGDAERLEGMAELMLARYDLRPGSAFVVISHSGINAVPVEMAMLGKKAGLTVIAVTALAHSQAVPARHSSGKKLYDVADIVIDTHGVPGDAALGIPGAGKSGSTSTLVGVAVIEALTLQAAAVLIERGIRPPLIISSNVPGGDAHNIELMARYRSRLAHSQVPSLLSPLLGEK
jgi:uncharacterized phosphosugar-binding protein